ncbi:hypothetical protein [Leucobacter massiliensis]|uniref:hypothetical protein n=1 Tax=Leucobacter massiliensis TaxID=1686285 RepID=UPI0011B24AED|nr:hypothetical protein [Leucobacter massiliensis]
MDENEDFESQQSSPAVAGAPGRLTEEQLSRNMMALHDGMNELGTRYDKHVFLAFEDPVTFGAGHYVFYPLEGHASRFAVTELYMGTDWRDDERVPTSWSWESEVHVPSMDGSYPWMTIAEGEIASDDYEQLLRVTENWAKNTYQLAERAEALTMEAVDRGDLNRSGPGRTFLT